MSVLEPKTPHPGVLLCTPPLCSLFAVQLLHTSNGHLFKTIFCHGASAHRKIAYSVLSLLAYEYNCSIMSSFFFANCIFIKRLQVATVPAAAVMAYSTVQ